jgi:hypothetical protein
VGLVGIGDCLGTWGGMFPVSFLSVYVLLTAISKVTTPPLLSDAFLPRAPTHAHASRLRANALSRLLPFLKKKDGVKS